MTATLIPNADDQRIAEQLLLAKTLREQGMSGTGGSGLAGNVYMVGNQYGNIAKSLGGAAMQYMGQQNRDTLDADRTRQYGEYMTQLPSATTMREQAGPVEEGQDFLPNVEVAKPTRQYQREMTDFAMNAPNIPQFQALRQTGLAQALSAPEKQAAAEEAARARLHERQLVLDDKQAQRDFQAAQDDKFKRTFEQTLALRSTPTVHITNGGANAPVKPPPGYRFKDNGDLEAIPGGPAAAKLDAASGKEDAAKRVAMEGVTELNRRAQALLDNPNLDYVTGAFMGSLPKAAFVASPDAMSARVDFDNFLEFLQTKGLSDLKAAGISPGSITEKEWPKFVARLTTLAAQKRTGELRTELKRLIDVSAPSATRVNYEPKPTDAAGGASPPPKDVANFEAYYNALQPGTRYIDPNGVPRIKGQK